MAGLHAGRDPRLLFWPKGEFGLVAPSLKKEFNKAIREAHKFRKDDLEALLRHHKVYGDFAQLFEGDDEEEEVEALPLKLPAGMAIPFSLGTTAEGQEVWEDFAEMHILVGGATDAGKTNVINLIIKSLMEKVDLCMVDPTCVGGAMWSRLPGVRYHDEDGAQAIADFKAKMDVRAKELRNASAYDITEYNTMALHAWRRQVLIVDEFPQLPKSAIASLKAIAQVGRKVGCHLIISTQRVNARTVDRDISTMFGAVVALRCSDTTESRLMLVKGAEKLRGKGDAILKVRGGQVHLEVPLFQGFNIIPERNDDHPLRHRMLPSEKGGDAVFMTRAEIEAWVGLKLNHSDLETQGFVRVECRRGAARLRGYWVKKLKQQENENNT